MVDFDALSIEDKRRVLAEFEHLLEHFQQFGISDGQIDTQLLFNSGGKAPAAIDIGRLGKGGKLGVKL